MQSTGTFTLGESAGDISDPKNIDFRLTDQKVTIHSQDALDIFGQSESCGHLPFEMDVAQNILDTGCNGSSGDMSYNVYKLDTSATPPELYYASSPSSSEDQRPTDINMDTVFRKQ